MDTVELPVGENLTDAHRVHSWGPESHELLTLMAIGVLKRHGDADPGKRLITPAIEQHLHAAVDQVQAGNAANLLEGFGRGGIHADEDRVELDLDEEPS